MACFIRTPLQLGTKEQLKVPKKPRKGQLGIHLANTSFKILAY